MRVRYRCYGHDYCGAEDCERCFPGVRETEDSREPDDADEFESDEELEFGGNE
jgi:hypothetical protein